MEPTTHNMCGACWSITAVTDWKGFNWDDEHENLVPSGDDPTFYRCPACLFDHSDDDTSPGVWDESLVELRAIRAAEMDDEPGYAEDLRRVGTIEAALKAALDENARLRARFEAVR